MRVGVTGTQYGAKPLQLAALYTILRGWGGPVFTELHHGVCIGADAQAHRAFRSEFGPNIKIVGHPPLDESRMATGLDFDELRAPKDYIARNHDMVDEVEGLIVIPRFAYEEIRSGTWATYRYAVKQFAKREQWFIYTLWPNNFTFNHKGIKFLR